MMWIAQTSAQWRHLPNDYGKWNSVFRRYRRLVTTGVFETMTETVARVAERDRPADVIDSTVVRAHHLVVGLRRGLRKEKRSADCGEVSPPNSTPDAMPEAYRSASC